MTWNPQEEMQIGSYKGVCVRFDAWFDKGGTDTKRHTGGPKGVI